MIRRPPFALSLAIVGVAAAMLSLPHGVVPVRAAEARDPAPPVARIVPKVFEEHANRRIDNYDWLRDRDDPQVIAHLRAENAYADARLSAVGPLVGEIAAELKARAADEDASVPYLDHGYVYERRFARGAQYPLIVRRKDAPGAAEEVVLDVPALASGQSYYRLDRWSVSPDGDRVAFAVDFTGARLHRIFVRTISTGEVVDQGIDGAAGDLVFAADGETLFYVRVDPKTFRAFQVWRHRIDADPDSDVLAYQEPDPTFAVSLSLSKSRKFVLLDIHQDQTSEMRYLPADRPEGTFIVMEPRRRGVRYVANHVGDKFYIRTNLDAPDFRVMTAPESAPARWTELVPQQPGRFLWRVEPFEQFIALDEERAGGMAIRVFRLSDMREIVVPRPAEIGVATTNFFFGGFGGNREPSASVLRFRFTGPLQPETIYDFDMARGTLTLRHEDPATKWVQPQAYGLDRIEALAADGERVPVTLVYRKELRRPGGNPTVVFGYGAYGFSSRTMFTAPMFSLLDRGFVYALAHVRGGREKGERWHEQGRVLNKRNSFTDFIAATEALIARGYADRSAVFAQGRSAGGLLVAAAANLRPDLFAGIVAEVPFVDVVTTMADATVPLTTLEYDEWGNPALKEHYDYMLSYSPYDNVAAKPYPPMFVTAGFHDSQVSYAEPAKWVARLRAVKTDDRELLFKVDMGAGHAGGSGRLGTVDDDAEIMAWMLAHATRAQ